MKAHLQPGAHGLELTPDLAAIEAIAEKLIFPSSNEEQVQVRTALVPQMHVCLIGQNLGTLHTILPLKLNLAWSDCFTSIP